MIPENYFEKKSNQVSIVNTDVTNIYSTILFYLKPH